MDCIAAISTAQTATAIGILRVSGEGCFALCDKVFRAVNHKTFAAQDPRKTVYGEMLDNQGRVIDRGLAVRFSGPHSYTGEDSAEFHCHGSPIVLRELLGALFAAGARQAGPGEFTRRAFLNGKLDLTEAEAVIDLIDAETPAAARNAAAQLDGALRRLLEPVQESLLEITSRFYAVVDYPDEDIQDIGPEEIASSLLTAETALTRLLGTAQRGKILKRGIRTAIVGRPNAGKSSLLNALAGYERAIVTDIPGTTRDTVEESVLCGGMQLRLIDTAGIRDTDDRIEAMGVERSKQAVENADLVIFVCDGSQPLTQEDRAIIELCADRENAIALINKSDLKTVVAPSDLPFMNVIHVCAATGEGLEQVADVVDTIFAGDTPCDGSVLTNPRQYHAIYTAHDAMLCALQGLRRGLTPDAVLTDVEAAMEAMGEVTGATVREDITARIFERFCVGK